MNYEKLSDIELLRLVERKDQQGIDAFKFVYRKHSAQVMGFCRYMIREISTAEDIFQETFIRFYNNVESKKMKSSIIGFLLKIARNICYDYLKKKNNYVFVEDCSFDLYEIPNDDDQSEEIEAKYQLLIESIELLSQEDKELLVLRIYNNLPYDKIAEVINTNESNARKKVFRAKLKLKKIIEPYYSVFENN